LQALIQKVKIDQIMAGELGITWEVNDTSQVFEFFIDRSGSPEGPFETLNAISIVDAYGYIDRTYNTEAFNREVYYRVRGVNSKETIISDIKKYNQEVLNYIGLQIARNKRLFLERIAGTKCFVFIRRTFGTKCTNCYDAVRQKSTSSNCQYCYGTTFLGGYFAPIKLFMQLNPLVRANQKTDLQNAENLRIDGVWCSNYPILAPGDLIVEVQEPNHRYVIESPVSRTEQHNALVEQRFPVTQIHLSRIEMQVPAPEDAFSINDVNIYRKDYI
jgi:hypothetical protein